MNEAPLCAASVLLGESDPRIDVLRQFRDTVLKNSPEGREIIRLYYWWGPVIVQAIEEDEEFKELVIEMVDRVLGVIRGERVE